MNLDQIYAAASVAKSWKEKVQMLIEGTLREAWPGDDMEDLLSFMRVNNFYSCSSHSHDAWEGGTAGHVWAVFLKSRHKRDCILQDDSINDADKENLRKYATDEKLAVVCLLHDICDMTIKNELSGHRPRDFKEVTAHATEHGPKSFDILNCFEVGTIAERWAVKKHMQRNLLPPPHLPNDEDKDEYVVLHQIVYESDHGASGTAWNKARQLSKRTQHLGKSTTNGTYLRHIAMDRTKQMIEDHCYVDEKIELSTFKGYGRKNVQWNAYPGIFAKLAELQQKRYDLAGNGLDLFTALRKEKVDTEKMCLVVGIDKTKVVRDNKLRCNNEAENSLLICSNILLCFYYSQEDRDAKGRKLQYKYAYSLHNDVCAHYNAQRPDTGIYLKDATIVRDGSANGFNMIKPWKVNLLLLPGWKGAPFAIEQAVLDEILPYGKG